MTCPICNSETDRRFRPFCSRRCADVDLGRWLTGAYAVPADDEDEVDESDRAPAAGEGRPH